MIEIFCQPTENNLAGPGHETLWKCATGNLVISKTNPAFRLQTVLALQTWQDKMGVKNYAGWDHQWVDYICL